MSKQSLTQAKRASPKMPSVLPKHIPAAIQHTALKSNSPATRAIARPSRVSFRWASRDSLTRLVHRENIAGS